MSASAPLKSNLSANLEAKVKPATWKDEQLLVPNDNASVTGILKERTGSSLLPREDHFDSSLSTENISAR
ncbi:hypothetical protein M758_UG319500 [Ceratodon purpureus]|nr:hypothetical protein M758_UG319500 [Ceratodon purpureus]